MAKITTSLKNTSDVIHNNTQGLNEGNYIHLTVIQKQKLDSVQNGAEVNVNADWNSTSGDSKILNKPTIPNIDNLTTKDYVDAADLVLQSNIDTKASIIYVNNSIDAVNISLNTKVDKVTGKSLISDSEITRLSTIVNFDDTSIQSELDTKVDKVVGERLINAAEITKLGNQSGINTGDETLSTIKSKLGITTLSGSNTGDQDLSGLVIKNLSITPGTNTKITYDAKGLVTSGTTLISSDIPNIAESQVINLVGDLASKEPNIAVGTTLQYWRGDKSFQTLDKSVVGLNNVDNTSDVNKPVSIAQQTALNLKEDLSNKATSFGTVNNTLYPTVQAVKTYADGLVVGLLDDRGSYNASVNTFPTTGGSGTAGAILKGDIWYVSVAGTLGGKAVVIGDSFRAITDTPGQTSGNWSLLSSNLGYVPANDANVIHTTGDETKTGSLMVQPVSTSTPAILGVSGSGYGVGGNSTSGVGLIGTSSSNYGVQALSTSGTGLQAKSTSGAKIATFWDSTAEKAYVANTGAVYSVTATAGQSDTQLATTAFVTTADNLKANLVSPTFTGSVTTPNLNITNGWVQYSGSGVNPVSLSTSTGTGKYTDGNVFVKGTNTLGGAVLNTGSLTGNNTFTFPNATGTFALTSDLSVYAPLASPTFTGTPSLPTGTIAVTQTAGDSSTKIATTAFVAAADAGNVKLTGNQTISGQKTFQNLAGGDAILINNTSTSTRGLRINSITGSTSDVFQTLRNGVETGKIDYLGNITSPSFIKSGATAGNILLAGGTDIAQSTFATTTGGTGYIQNQNTSAQSANMWISGISKSANIITDKTTGGFWQSTNGATNHFVIGTDNNIGGGSINDLSYYSYAGLHKFYQSVDVRASYSFFGSQKGYTYVLDDQINSYYSTDADANLNINYFGYNGGATRFRGLTIWNGKSSAILTLTGSTGAATFASTVTAPTFVGALTGSATLWNNLGINTTTGAYTATGILGTDGTATVKTLDAPSIKTFLGLSTAIIGTGTTNYIPKWTGTGTQGNSILYDDGTTLSVLGGNKVINFDGATTGTLSSSADASTINLSTGTSGGYQTKIQINGGSSATPNTLIFNTASTERMRIANSGNILLGTASEISGINPRAIIKQGGDSDWRGLVVAANGNDSFLGLHYNGTDYDIAPSYSSTAGYKDLGFTVGGVRTVTFKTSGNVGIGTNSPAKKLDVAGDAIFTSTVSMGRDDVVGQRIIQITPSSSISANIQGILAGTGSTSISMQSGGGNVLIGTTTDTGDKLNVNGNLRLTNSDSRFYGGDTAGRAIFSNSDTSNYIALYGSAHAAFPFVFSYVTNGAERLNISQAGVVKINNLSGTGTRTVVADASGNLSATNPSYKVYTAIIAQSGTSAPTATTVLENTLGGTVTFSRLGVGQYTADLTGAFTSGKTIVFFTNDGATAVGGNWRNANAINLSSPADGQIFAGNLEIRVYP